MKTLSAVTRGLAVLFPAVLFAGNVSAQISQPPVAGKSQLHFEENKGQWPAPVIYKSDLLSGHVFFERNSFLFSFYSHDDLDRIHEETHKAKSTNVLHKMEQQKVRCHAYRVTFPGAQSNAVVAGTGKLAQYSNYFIGNDPQKWAGDVGNYSQVNYTGLYPGIDANIYSNGLNLKYDLIVSPGADADVIRMSYDGISKMKLDDGKLVLSTAFMDITEAAPYAYQVIDGKKIEVPCRFVLQGNEVSFEFPSGYNKRIPLVIDPVIVASTYSGSTATTYGHSATYDLAGNIYSAGRCFGTGYPVTTGAYDLTFAGSVDISISKYNPTGTSLTYATYIGGTSDEYAHSMFVHNNELYIYGSAGSTDYPTTAGAFDATHNGGTYDIIVTHLNSTGSALVGSTYVGGSANDGSNAIYTHYGDPYRGEIIVDGAGNALVASFTSSTNFPATAGAYDVTANGMQDGCVIKLDPAMSALTWATYLGGSNNDAAFGIRLNSTGDVFTCGGTSSTDFPITVGTYQTTYQGGSLDGFLVQLTGNGATLNASTYFGTNALDEAFFLDVDYDDDVYIYGEAQGGAPVTAGVYSVANSGMFVAKFPPALNSLLFSTTVGNGGLTSTLAPSAFMVDVCKNIYFAGFGASGYPVTANAFYSGPTVGTSWLCALSPGATSLLFATYYGANHVDGGTSRFDPSGVVYHAVCQGGTGFPTTAGAYSPGLSPPGWDVCVFKIDFEQMGVQAQAAPAPNSSGCAPFVVNFTNGSNGVDYIWDFGDGSPQDTSSSPSHQFDSTGTYTVMLIAIDSASCNISDTAYVTITVLNQISAFLGNDTTFCPPGTILLDAGISGATYQWSTGASTQTISVGSPGDYWVTVSLGSNCTATDSISVQTFTYPGAGPNQLVCPGNAVTISAAYPGGTYVWSTGETTPEIQVTSAGQYWVQMTYGNCVVYDTVAVDYTVGGEVMPPNFFTPDGIGVNDVYDIGNPSRNGFHLEIYNRWGELMFDTFDPAIRWEGTYNGKICPEGVYYWIVFYEDCTGTPAEDHGFVHLMR